MPTPTAMRLRLLATGRACSPRVYGHAARLAAVALSASTLLSVSARPLQAGTVHWKTAGGGLWNVAANWDTNGVPQSGDDVFNDLFGSLITLNSSATIGSFHSNSAYTISGGTLTGSKTLQASTVQVNDTFTVNNGTLNNLTINAGSGGQGVTFTGNSNNITNVIFNAGASFGTGSFAEVSSGSNVVNSLLNMAGGQARLYDSGTALTLGSQGVLQGFGTIDQSYGGTTLTNNGTVTANNSMNLLTLSTSNINGTGTYQAIGNATLSIGGTLTGSNAIVHADMGTVLIDGGGLSGTFAASTGSGVSFSSNSNSINNAVVHGNLTFGAGAFAEVSNGGNSLDNGTATFAGGQARLYDSNAVLTLGSQGVLQGYGSISQSYGGTTLTNNGTINANVSGKTLTISTSTINVAGTLQASNTGVLSLGGQVVGTNATIISDTGTVLVDGGGLSGSFASSTGTGITFSGGNNNITNAVINGNLTLSNGFAEVYNGANRVTGTATLAGAHLRLYDSSAVFTVDGGTLQGFGTIDQSYGGTTLTNNGTVTANNSMNLLTLSTSNINGTGTYQAIGNATLSIGGTLTGSNAIVHADMGTVLIDGGGLSGTFAASTGSGVSFSSNSNSINNAVVHGNLTFGAGAFAEVSNSNGVDNGTLFFSGGQARLYDSSAVLTLGSQGVLQGYGSISQSYGGTTLTNNGTINANVSGKTLTISTSNLNGVGTFEGSNGGVLTINGFLNGNNVRALADTGTVQFDGGGLGGSVLSTTGSGFSFTGSGDNSINNVVVGSGATLTFGVGAFAEVYNGGNTLNGTATFAGGQARLYDSNAVLTLGSQGVLQGYGSISQSYGGTTLTNNGTINANTSGQTLTISPSNFANNGTAQTVSGATLTVNSTTTNTGAIKAVAASSIFLNAGATQTAGSTTVDGTLNTNGQTFNLKGGTLTGAGTLVGPVNNTGGTVNPGDTTGVFTLTGNYTQGNAGSLFVDLAGDTQGQTYDVFKVSGTATLHGQLGVQTLNGFTPFIGETFDILNYKNRVGGFDVGAFNSIFATDGSKYTLAYNDTIGVATLTYAAAPVPEAGTVVSLGALLGLCGIARARSRRRAA